VFSRSQLIELVWPDEIAGAIDSDRTVDVHIRRIRVQLGDAARLIQTIAGVGYKLQAVTTGS
jgi:DNA-binding response OmpR family regulator